MRPQYKLILLLTLLFGAQFSLASSPIKINKIPLDFKLLSFPLMPGDTALIELNSNSKALLSDTMGNSFNIIDYYNWIAPTQAGVYTIQIQIEEEKFQVKFLVMKSIQQIQDTPNDFIIGKYPKKAYKNLSQYNAPKGMIEVTKNNQNEYVSNHFQLKDFLVKQKSGYPKYLIINTKLLYKLELIISRLQSNGIHVKHLQVMSGYRTPYYNGNLGNSKSSRHIYGDAADIYVDNDRNGAMDDLNKDGKINIKDAKVLAEIVEKIESKKQYQWLIGGLGVYKSNRNHRGFIHVDTRGFTARW